MGPSVPRVTRASGAAGAERVRPRARRRAEPGLSTAHAGALKLCALKLVVAVVEVMVVNYLLGVSEPCPDVDVKCPLPYGDGLLRPQFMLYLQWRPPRAAAKPFSGRHLENQERWLP